MTAVLPVAGPVNDVQRRTWVVDRNDLPTRSGQHWGRCGWCGLQAFSSTSGGVDGFFGAHQGTDGTTPSCAAMRAGIEAA